VFEKGNEKNVQIVNQSQTFCLSRNNILRSTCLNGEGFLLPTGWPDSKDPVLVRTIESREYNAPWRKGSTNYCKYRMEAPSKDSRLGLSDDRGPRNLDLVTDY
jgi:hypothetical protein